MNLIDSISGSFGGEAINRISTLLGVNKEEARTAVGASVPTMLAAFTGAASTPDGAQRLYSAVSDLDNDTLGNYNRSLTGDASAFTRKGTSLLNSICGGPMISSIGGILSKFTGMGAGTISSLLGLAAPAVLGYLKREQVSRSLDASGMASMLSGQKQEIFAAMPSGLSGMLSGVPGLGAPGGGETARSYAQPAREYVEAARQPFVENTAARNRNVAGVPATAYARPATTGSSNALKWVLPLLLVALGGWLLYSFLHNPTTATPSPRTTPPPVMAPQDRNATPAPSEIYDTVSKNFNSITSDFTNELSNVTDAESAEAAVPHIRSLASRLQGLQTTTSQLPADLRTNFSSLVSSSKSKLQAVIDRVMAIPGVSDTLKPAVDDFMGKLSAF